MTENQKKELINQRNKKHLERAAELKKLSDSELAKLTDYSLF